MKLGACPRLRKYIIAIEKTNYSDSHCPLLKKLKLSYKKIVNIIVKSKFTWLEKNLFQLHFAASRRKRRLTKSRRHRIFSLQERSSFKRTGSVIRDRLRNLFSRSYFCRIFSSFRIGAALIQWKKI